MGSGNQWKGPTQQTRHKNQGERHKKMVLCGCHSAPWSLCFYERNKKGFQVSGTGRESMNWTSCESQNNLNSYWNDGHDTKGTSKLY